MNVQNSLGELQDIIFYEKKLYNILEKIEIENFKSHQEKLLKIIGGAGLTNSLYEKFAKLLLKTDSELKKKRLLRHPKNLSKVEILVSDLKLELGDSFNIKKIEINKKNKNFPISTYQELIERLKSAYEKRNHYIHGDFGLEEEISNKDFKTIILETIELQIFLTELLKIAFIRRLHSYEMN